MCSSRACSACRSRDSSASSRKRTCPRRSIRGLSTRRMGFSGSSPAPLAQAPCFPGLDVLNGDGRERLRIPGSKMPMQLLKSVGRRSWAARIDPGRIRVSNEQAQCHSVAAADPMQRVVAMRLLRFHLGRTPRNRWVALGGRRSSHSAEGSCLARPKGAAREGRGGGRQEHSQARKRCAPHGSVVSYRHSHRTRTTRPGFAHDLASHRPDGFAPRVVPEFPASRAAISSLEPGEVSARSADSTRHTANHRVPRSRRGYGPTLRSALPRRLRRRSRGA